MWEEGTPDQWSVHGLLPQFGSQHLADLEAHENAESQPPALKTLIQAGWEGWPGYLHFDYWFTTSQR